MKKTNVVWGALLSLLMMGCSGTAPIEEFISIDVTADYPKKELVLQDFMDVEYVPLETTDEFLVKGKVADIGKNLIILTNMREGDILLFDRKGKGVKKINRRGQGPEEYILPFNVYLNKEENELIVNDGPSSKIQVYDLEGNYKRTINYKKGALVTCLYDYDATHFLSQDIYAFGNESSTSTFFLMSKEDGSRTDIEVPYEKRISTVMIEVKDGMVRSCDPRTSFITSYKGDWILTEPSADTIYRHQTGAGLQPFIVRTPSVQRQQPEVFLFPGILTDRYYFMQSVKKECDFSKEDTSMPKTLLVYDKQAKQVYEYEVKNADFDGREEDLATNALNEEIAFAASLEADELKEANEAGKLKGALKQVAEKLGEDDNPVILLAKEKR